jgi:hypothetical protein
MLVVNPRGRKRRTKRRSTAKRTARRNPRRNGRKRSKASYRRAALKGLRTRRRNPRRRKRRNTKRRGGRKLASRTYYRANPRRRKRRRNTKRRRRRNPSTKGMFGGIQKTLKGIPVIGPVLAGAVGVIPTAAFGAISVEPTMWLASAVAPFLPEGLGSSWLYAGSGVLFAGIAKAWLPGLIGKKWANDLAVAAAAAGGAVAYYKMRTGTDVDIATEVGMLEYSGVGLGALTIGPSGYGDGMAYSVQPYPGAVGYGALEVVGA